MSNPFEKHGLGHLSASSLNLYAAEPALWAMEKLLKLKHPSSAVMARGKAAEAGIHLGLMQPFLSPEACVGKALQEYDSEMALLSDSKREDERNNLAGYVEAGLKELRQYGVPTAYQEKVEVRLDDVPVPIIGFIDWRFDQHGLIVDLKTGERLPSDISDPHGRQGAIYAEAHGNYGMRFAYAKPVPGKKDGRSVVVFQLSGEERHRHLAALRQIATRLGRFLALSADPHELCGLLVPNYESFYWANPTARGNARTVYGF